MICRISVILVMQDFSNLQRNLNKRRNSELNPTRIHWTCFLGSTFRIATLILKIFPKKKFMEIYFPPFSHCVVPSHYSSWNRMLFLVLLCKSALGQIRHPTFYHAFNKWIFSLDTSGPLGLIFGTPGLDGWHICTINATEIQRAAAHNRKPLSPSAVQNLYSVETEWYNGMANEWLQLFLPEKTGLRSISGPVP